MKKIEAYFKLITSKRYSTHAGTLSFFFLLSCVPLCFITFYIFNLFANKIEFISTVDTIAFLEFDFTSSISVLFILTTFYSASKLFFHIRKTGEIIYDHKKINRGIKNIIASFTSLFIFLCIFVSGLLFIFGTEFFITKFRVNFLARLITYSLFGLLIFVTLLLVNYQASPHTRHVKKYVKGSLFSLIYILVASLIFVLYLRFFANYEHLYGYLATLLILLLWVYIINTGVVIGIIINSKKH